MDELNRTKEPQQIESQNQHTQLPRDTEGQFEQRSIPKNWERYTPGMPMQNKLIDAQTPAPKPKPIKKTKEELALERAKRKAAMEKAEREALRKAAKKFGLIIPEEGSELEKELNKWDEIKKKEKISSPIYNINYPEDDAVSRKIADVLFGVDSNGYR